MKKTCTDHLGNVFPSMRELAKHYNMSPDTLGYRLRKGMSLEKALTTPVETHTPKTYTDHLGNVFENLDTMAAYHHISKHTLRTRLNTRMSIEKALTTPIRTCETKTYTDYLGNVFPNICAMAKHYNIPSGTLRKRLDAGMSLEEALTKPIQQIEKIYIEFFDHVYETKKRIG